MIATIDNFQVDLSKPIDISIPLSNTDDNPIAWYVENQLLKLFVLGMGGEMLEACLLLISTLFNPHGHGTHTECLGHITHKFYSVNQALKQFFFIAELVSVELVDQESDFVTKSGDIKSFKWQNQKQLSSGLCRMTLIKYPEKHSIPTLLIWLKRPHCFFAKVEYSIY
jgi:hypothetical protein